MKKLVILLSSILVSIIVTGPSCYVMDLDGDNVQNQIDNCPYVANPDQEDLNDNGIGNACDDSDQDGTVDIIDNCPLFPNPDQMDWDGDQMGDACDADMDNDEIDNQEDNCPQDYNPSQENICHQ